MKLSAAVWLRRSLCLLGLLAAAPPAVCQTYAWKEVVIKGGGFVSGIVTHPNVPGLMYCRCDIGGAYRWNAATSSWIPLLDFLAQTNGDSNLMGVDSIGLDPSDSNRLYLACSFSSSPKTIFTSTNQGASFTRVNVSFQMEANNDGRSNGERLAVDPNLGSTIFYASRFNGLWKSVNYGANWSQVSSFPVASTTNGVGLIFVQFVQSSGTPGSATPTIFIGVSQPKTNLFVSYDAGSTWAWFTNGAPVTQMPHHAALDGLGNMYVTFCDGPGPNNITAGSVRKFNLPTLASVSVTPPTGQGGFAGVSVDPQNPMTLLVSTMDRWYPNPQDQVYRSVNGGTTWRSTNPNAPATTPAPWSVAQFPHWIGDVEIDPFNSNRACYITGYGVLGCTNLTASDSHQTVNWTFMSDGIEETVPLGLVSPPTGPHLLSVHGDIGGFQHFDLDASPPLSNYFNTHQGTQRSIDFAGVHPATVARTFDDSPFGAYSTDGGSTWNDFPSFPPTTANGAGSIAVSADGSRMVWIPINSAAYWSADDGATWTASTGGLTTSSPPIADRVNSSKFYIYSGSHVYVSANGGVSFSSVSTLVSGGGTLSAVFGREGDVWEPVSSKGLYHSSNSGTNFTLLANVQGAYNVGFGKPAPGQSYPAVFINGRVTNTWGFFRSDDAGATWIQINDRQHQYGWVEEMVGDPNIYGRVYVAASGRGILYADLLPLPGPVSLASAMVDNNLQFSWPLNYTGWLLQAQTNEPGVGLGAVWTTVTGSDATNQWTVPIDAANGSVFFRLAHP